jgi:hypothetical protein
MPNVFFTILRTFRKQVNLDKYIIARNKPGKYQHTVLLTQLPICATRHQIHQPICVIRNGTSLKSMAQKMLFHFTIICAEIYCIYLVTAYAPSATF